MDVNTGKILAMASLGNYDLNDFLAVSEKDREYIDEAETKEEAAERLAAAQAKQWRNKALSDTYEPGSTFKIITLAMALEEGAVSLDDTFYCGGNVSVIGRTSPIRCWKTTGHGSQTLTQAAQHSCNAAFVNIGLRVGAERFYDYCEAFGFLRLSDDPDANLTAKTGIDLSGESGEHLVEQEYILLAEKPVAACGGILRPDLYDYPASARVRRERVCKRRVPDGALRCAADAEPRRERCI